jgi:hypothetical protein
VFADVSWLLLKDYHPWWNSQLSVENFPYTFCFNPAAATRSAASGRLDSSDFEAAVVDLHRVADGGDQGVAPVMILPRPSVCN